MKTNRIIGYVALLTLFVPNLSTAASDFATTRLNSVLSRTDDVVEKEAVVKNVAKVSESKIGAYRGKTDTVSRKKLRSYSAFKSAVESISVPFSFSGTDISKLDTAVREGKLTLATVSIRSTPVLYRPDFSAVFGTETGTGLLLDEYGQIDPLEYVALPGTVFRVKGIAQDGRNVILNVETDDYPYSTDKGYYVDARFVTTYWTPVGKIRNRKAEMPKPEEMIERLRSMSGLPYVWGGNAPQGIPEMLSYYGPTGAADQSLQNKWTMRGVDCSGLLYAATDGSTPRNTSSLVRFGTGLDIAGKSANEIASMLMPLDVIVWKGHAIIVLDETSTIESAGSFDEGSAGFPDGVRIRKTADVITSLLSKRVAVNDIDDAVPEGKKKFVIRRWLPENRPSE